MKTFICFAILVISLSGCNGTPDNSVTNENKTNQQQLKNEISSSSDTDLQYSQQKQKSAADTQKNLPALNNGKPKNKEIEKPFSRKLQSGKISFYIFCKNDANQNQLIIRTKGFDTFNGSFTHKINGQVTKAEVADLNNDDYPELYVFYSSAKNNGKGDIIAYNSNRNLSATPIYIRHPAKTNAALKGYIGYDNFYFENKKLVREFMVEGEKPRSDKRRIIYKLIRGETSLILEMESWHDTGNK